MLFIKIDFLTWSLKVKSPWRYIFRKMKLWSCCIEPFKYKTVIQTCTSNPWVALVASITYTSRQIIASAISMSIWWTEWTWGHARLVVVLWTGWKQLHSHVINSVNITRTSEQVITLWRSCELYLCRNISRVCRMSEISLLKTMNMISTYDHHELVLVFMPYIIDWILLLMVYMYNFKEFNGETAIS